MKTIELQLDEQTFDLALRLAEARHYSLERLVTDIIKQIAEVVPGDDLLLGMFSKETDIIDQIIKTTMFSRETAPLRLSNDRTN